jgi:hypothetical protein
MLFLDVGRKTVEREARETQGGLPTVYYKFLSRSLLFAGAVIAPAGILLLAGWPGWEQLYWTERVENVIFHWPNALLPGLFVIAIVLGAWAGHAMGYWWLTTGRARLLRPTYLGVLAAVSLLVLVNYPAFTVVGTYHEYRTARQAMPVAWSNPHSFGTAWVTVMVYFSAVLLWLVFRIRREAQRA